MKKKSLIQIVFCSLFILVISFVGIFTLMNSNEKSLVEGRKLTLFPEINLENIVQNKFYTELTDAFSDQMVGRDYLIKSYYKLNISRYTGGIAKGEDNQLFMTPLMIQNKEKRKQNLANVAREEISSVAEKVTKAGSRFIFLSIPRKDVLMEEYLPSTYIKGTENYLREVEIIKSNVSNKVQVIDSYELIKGNESNPYYSTDHHMNIQGAYILFEHLVKLINKDGHNIQLGSLKKEFEVRSQVINGSLNRKIGQTIANEPEILTLTYKNNNLKYTRKDNGETTTVPIFGQGNTYASAYMGADYAETVVDTNNDNAPNVLFVGTSFTNILEALSVCKFNKVVGIDYRHNKTGKSVADYVKEHDIDYTVFICSLETDGLSPTLIKKYLGPN